MRLIASPTTVILFKGVSLVECISRESLNFIQVVHYTNSNREKVTIITMATMTAKTETDPASFRLKNNLSSNYINTLAFCINSADISSQLRMFLLINKRNRLYSNDRMDFVCLFARFVTLCMPDAQFSIFRWLFESFIFHRVNFELF